MTLYCLKAENDLFNACIKSQICACVYLIVLSGYSGKLQREKETACIIPVPISYLMLLLNEM